MFLLDSLFMSGFRWVLNTVVTAAEAEMNDDTALREQLLDAEMRREMGEISDDEFAAIEADLLARIREIKERREGGSGPIGFGGEPMEASPGGQFAVEATVSGDFHEPAGESGTELRGTLVEPAPEGPRPAAAAGRRRTPGAARTATTRRTAAASRAKIRKR